MAEKRFNVVFSLSAERDIAHFPPDNAVQVVRDIQKYLETSPLPYGKSRIKKMTGFKPDLYRLRSGDFRAYYSIIGRDVVVLAITHKKDSEKVLKKMR